MSGLRKLLLALLVALLPSLACAADLTVTAANVAKFTGATTDHGTAGETITAGQPVYIDATDSGRLKRCDANAGLANSQCVGIALHASSAGQPLTYLVSGEINPGATVTVGTVYVVSANAGGIAPVSDLASGWYTTILGVGTASNKIYVSLVKSGVQVP